MISIKIDSFLLSAIEQDIKDRSCTCTVQVITCLESSYTKEELKEYFNKPENKEIVLSVFANDAIKNTYNRLLNSTLAEFFISYAQLNETSACILLDAIWENKVDDQSVTIKALLEKFDNHDFLINLSNIVSEFKGVEYYTSLTVYQIVNYCKGKNQLLNLNFSDSLFFKSQNAHELDFIVDYIDKKAINKEHLIHLNLCNAITSVKKLVMKELIEKVTDIVKINEETEQLQKAVRLPGVENKESVGFKI